MKRTMGFLLGGGGLFTGIALATWWLPSFLVLAAMLSVAVILALLFWRTLPLKRAGIFIAFATLGFLYVHLWQEFAWGNIPFGSRQIMQATVATCRATFQSYRCIIDVFEPFDSRLLVESKEDWKPGTKVALEGVISELSPNLHYLLGDGVAARVHSPAIIEHSERSSSFRAILATLRSKSETRLFEILTEPSASLAAGLLFGSRQTFSDDFVDALKRTNTMHIIAVSGMNITILAEFVRRFLIFLPRKSNFVLTSAVIAIFVAMVGAPASAVRAGTMGVLTIFAKLIGRRVYVPSLILLTALVMSLPNPYIVRYELGFQLSFLAFLGLVALAPAIELRLWFLPKPLRGPTAASMGATLATSPIITQLSNGMMSLVGPVANLFVLPLIPLIMLLAGLVLLVSLLSLKFAQLLGFLLFLPSLFVVTVIEKFSQPLFATVPWLLAVSLITLAAGMSLLFGRKRALAK